MRANSETPNDLQGRTLFQRLCALLALPFAVVGCMVCSVAGPISLAIAFVLAFAHRWRFTAGDWLLGLSPAGWGELQFINALLWGGVASVIIGVLLRHAAYWLSDCVFNNSSQLTTADMEQSRTNDGV